MTAGAAGSNRFEIAARAALNACPGLLYRWLPGGKLVGPEYDALNPTRVDHTTGSFRVNIQTGKWADFASDAKGGDLISLYAYLYQISQFDAVQAVEVELGIDPTNGPSCNLPSPPTENDDACLMPIPEDAPPPPSPNGSSQEWLYLAANGGLLGVVFRFDQSDGKKDFRPLTYWSKSGWKRKSWPRPAPLFNLQDLAERPDAPVMVVEGEKTAVAGSEWFPEFVVMTWPGGSSRAGHADWTALADRRVWLLPDADEPGRKAMQVVAEVLLPLAAELHLTLLHPANQVLPEGWDVADADWSSLEAAESWLASLKWVDLKPQARDSESQDARFEQTLARANGHGTAYQAKKLDEPALEAIPVPILDQLEREILARVPLRCPLAARVTVKTIIAHLAGRQVISALGDPTGSYAVLCAPSIGFVRPYLALAREIIDQIGLEKTVRTQRLSTTQQLFKTLWRQPKTLWLSSEWGILLQFAKRQPAGNIEQTLTVMSEVWDGKPLAADADEVRLSGGDSDGQYLIRVPHLTLLAALAHDQLAMALKLSEMGRGALEQIQYWLLDGEEFEEVDPDDLASGPLPATLINALRAIATPPDSGNLVNIALPDQIPGRRVATFCSPIKTYFEPIAALPLDAESRPLGFSARLIARREATALAFCVDRDAPTVTPELLRHAVDGEARRLRRLLDRFSVLSSDDGKLSTYEKVLDFITSQKDLGAGDRALQRRCRAYRNLPDDKRQELIKQLVLDGAVIEVTPESKLGARRKAVVYVAKAFVEKRR